MAPMALGFGSTPAMLAPRIAPAAIVISSISCRPAAVRMRMSRFSARLKIHRALQDALLCSPSDVLLRSHRLKSGYRLEAFLPAAVLNGYDPDQNRRLGFFYAIRDAELGEQLLSAGAVFPYPEDPSLWSVLELKK